MARLGRVSAEILSTASSLSCQTRKKVEVLCYATSVVKSCRHYQLVVEAEWGFSPFHHLQEKLN